MNINGNATISTFENINVDNISSIDNSSNIELGSNEIDLIATNVLINGVPIVGGGVSNPMTSDLDCNFNDLNNVKIIRVNGATVQQINTSQTGCITVKENSKLGGVIGISNIGSIVAKAYNDTNTSITVGEAGFRSSQSHTIGASGTDYIILTTPQNTATATERLKIGSDGTTYITGNTDMYGNCRNKLGVTNSFAVTDDTAGPFQLLRFSVSNTQIVSQIKHLFTAGLEPVNNLLGDIGSNIKKFNTLWIDKINGLTPVGGLYSGLSNGALISGGTIGSLLPLSGVGSLSVPANGFSVGDSFHLVCAGDIPIGDKDDIITITLNQDGSQLAALSVDMEDSTNTFFELEADFQVRSIGIAGQIVTNFDFTFNKTLLKDFKGSRKVQLSTIDTTSASTLSLTAQFAGDLNSTIQTRLFYLRKQY